MDSVTPVNFVKRNVMHEVKLRDPHLKINAVNQGTKDLYCGFMDDPIKIVGQVIVSIRSIECTYDKTSFFITDGH